jgi:hypothetical protein
MKNQDPIFEGNAALTLFEALAIALAEKDLLSKDEIRTVLEDAAQAHRKQVKAGGDASFHLSVANMIERISIGANSVSASRRRLVPNARPSEGRAG